MPLIPRKVTLSVLPSHLRHAWKLARNALRFLMRQPRTAYRTLGFHVIPAWATKWENPKAVWDHSQRRVLARSLIHIIPSLVSIGIITLNLKGYFIGHSLEGFHAPNEIKLGLIQVAAKLHELLIISSMGSVIFHYLRVELLFGNGVPLGLLASGWSFAQISYLWSADFIGGAKSCYAALGSRRWHGISFLILVVMGSILTVLAGPVSAMLMVPVRSQWLTGGGIAWMNGSAAQLWPSELNAEYFADLNCSTPINQFEGADPCPSTGFIPLHHLLSTSTNGWATRSQVDLELREKMGIYKFHSRFSERPFMDPWVYTAHHATSSLQDALRTLHYEALSWLAERRPNLRPFPRHLMRAESVRMEVATRAPAVRVNCNLTTAAFSTPLGRLKIKFPVLQEGISSSWYQKPPEELQADHESDVDHYFETVEFDLTNHIPAYLFKRGLITTANIPLNETELFAEDRRIIIIPKDIWSNDGTANSLGLVILLDGNDDPHKAVNFRALACSIDARWADAKSVMTVLPEKQPGHDFIYGGTRVAASIELPGGGNGVLGRLGVESIKLPLDGTWSAIRLHESWFNLFSPPVPDEIFPTRDLMSGPRPGQTSLEKLLDLVYVGGNFSYGGAERAKFSTILSSMLADGVARTGLHFNLNTSLATMESIFGPDGYNISLSKSWFTWVSMVLLLIHAAIIFIHSARVVFRRESGDAWDTITELVILAQNSTPDNKEKEMLVNTTSGIHSLRTFGLVAWVENSQERPEGCSEGEGKLRLALSQAPAMRDEVLKPKMDDLYN